VSLARRPSIALLAVLPAMGAAVALSFAAASSGAPAPAKITAAGAGGVKLGRTYTSLRVAGLLGKIGPGCELAGPHTRSAPLLLPLQGGADLSTPSPRKVIRVTVAGGGSARGVGVGDTQAAARAAFPKATLDHSGEKVFGVTIVRVPKGGGGRLEFAIGTKTKKVTLIGVPGIAFCD
jgi:hypothetical protein